MTSTCFTSQQKGQGIKIYSILDKFYEATCLLSHGNKEFRANLAHQQSSFNYVQYQSMKLSKTCTVIRVNNYCSIMNCIKTTKHYKKQHSR